MDTWRLIYSPPASGAWNMALDEAILESAASGQVRPTLRFFAWVPPALSLGVAQPAADADQAALARLGWDLVRRPTGGRAILHTDELTYSISAPENHPLAHGGVLESYRRFSRGLLAGLRRMGIEVQAESEYSRGATGAVCFETPSSYEITAGGKKLIGSAQARLHGGVLQHGTLPLAGELSRILQVLAHGDSNAERIHARAITLEEAAGKTISWQECADSIRYGFESELEMSFVEEFASSDEQIRSLQLVEEKYANDRWTLRR